MAELTLASVLGALAHDVEHDMQRQVLNPSDWLYGAYIPAAQPAI